MTVDEAQRDLRRAFVGGGPGTFVSGLVWLAAALVHDSRGVMPAFAVLFFGGMLIFPATLLLCRFAFGQGKPTAGNGLGRVVLESTIAMIAGLLAAALFEPYRPDYVLPLCAVAVGTHYAVFKTAYGNTLFWVLGAAMTGVGVVEILDLAEIPMGPAWWVGALEILFAVVLTVGALRTGSGAR